MNAQQQKYKISKAALLFTTVTKATSDAVTELLLRQGYELSQEEIMRIGVNRRIEYASSIKALYNALPENDQTFLADSYLSQWIDSYLFLQEKLLEFVQA